MHRRCGDENDPSYSYYGGRGIRVCERWRDFGAFLGDMGKRPSKSHTLDRKRGNGGYEPNNCRWATKREQQQNRRDTKLCADDVQKIRQMRAGGKSQPEIGRLFSIAQNTVSRICARETWANVA
jgi:hypothetical protein